ncbi:MAG: 16S rRNA (uracil(1498)-N(3))-methyltransferase [Synechococcus sp. Tobar2m-G35]|nr:16S rRNA (uracil(1498)-N(3))-methyltransferase [Synechococcus sp. Tobar2m-G35]
MAEQRRLLIPPDRLPAHDAALLLTEAERHYLERVLRLRPGDGFTVVDGVGGLRSAWLQTSGRADLGPPLPPAARPRPQLGVLAALVRRDFDVLLRMATELGVDQLLPLQADRSPPAAASGRGSRWESLLREASEQCERLWLPQLGEVMPARSAFTASTGANERRWLCLSRNAGIPSLLDQLLLADPLADAGWWVACGPEGGWTPQEEALALAAGWQPVSLGPTILRSSTAAVAGLTLLSQFRVSGRPAAKRPDP